MTTQTQLIICKKTKLQMIEIENFSGNLYKKNCHENGLPDPPTPRDLTTSFLHNNAIQSKDSRKTWSWRPEMKRSQYEANVLKAQGIMPKINLHDFSVTEILAHLKELGFRGKLEKIEQITI